VKTLVVGEDNPYGGDPRMALFHLPRYASGNRLREHLGLTDAQYVRLQKMNLCPEKWSMKIAREVANAIRRRTDLDLVIMLGSKVKRAFDMQDMNFFVWGYYEQPGPALLSLPHPSGRNLLWNAPNARQKAQEVIRKAWPAFYETPASCATP
jgi:hypothetical protein